MKNYYTYVSKKTKINQPIWTEPYTDFFGFGRMVTVSIPIYHEEPNKIIGVAGIDIVMSQIEKLGLGED